MFPLIGVLFLITIGGILAGLVSLFFKKIRFLASYLFLSPFFAAFFSFWLFWGGGLLVEHFFGATRWSSLAALLGYTDGFFVGGFCGVLVAYKINKIFFTQHGAVHRMRKKPRPGNLYR